MSNKTNSKRRQLLKATALGAGAGLAGTLPLGANSQDSRYGIVGRDAPEIRLDYWIDGDGNDTTFSVKESKGKWVMLKFFQNWCPGCHRSGFPTLKKFADEFHGHPKVAIAGVQTVFEGFQSNRKEHVRKLQLQYDLPNIMGHDIGTPATDNMPLTMINYIAGGTPWLVVINPDGIVEFNDFHVNVDGLIGFIKQEVG